LVEAVLWHRWARWLQGAVLTFKPTVAMPVWAEKAPKIAGLPEWEKDAAIRFLMTGIAYNDYLTFVCPATEITG